MRVQVQNYNDLKVLTEFFGTPSVTLLFRISNGDVIMSVTCGQDIVQCGAIGAAISTGGLTLAEILADFPDAIVMNSGFAVS